MSNENPISLFPQQRIKAYDGMPVTADTWEKAHSYHRSALQSHHLFFHGEGILMGLEVVASDPADHIIYVLPGVAVDGAGQLIVLAEPVAYDLGNEVEGPLFLVISHRESTTAVEKSLKQGLPQSINDEFLLIARAQVPEGEWVELARFQRESRSAPIRDAASPQKPGLNEIDLRYRRRTLAAKEKQVTAATAYLGKVKEKAYGAGLARLCSELRAGYQVNLVVDDDLPVDPGLLGYDAIFLVAQGAFKLQEAQASGLKGYLQGGGVLLMEALDEEALESFRTVLTQFKTPLQPPAAGSPLMAAPYLFAAPPPGYHETGQLWEGSGILLSTYYHGRIWNGEMESRLPQRHELRSAVEWGANLVNYILERKAG